LSALLQGEWYGYALVAIPGIGVAEGSIYPLLSRLGKQGLVTTRLEEGGLSILSNLTISIGVGSG